jgi:nucleoid DNA-binding protein
MIAFKYEQQGNMIKRELISKVAKETKHKTDDIRPFVLKTLDYIADALADGKTVELRDFGIFKIKVRQERKGRNPNKPKDEVVIPKRAVVAFRAGKALKEKINKLDIAKLKKVK